MTSARFSVSRPSRPAADARLVRFGGAGDVVGVDADREGLGAQRPVARRWMRAVVEQRGAEVLDEVAAEVRGVALGLEADEVEGAEAAGEPLVLRQRGEDLGRRERDVQEEAHPPFPARGAQLGAHQQEVVVVHPDDVVGTGELRQQPGEAAVDRLVGGELGLVEVREVDAVVEHRPERAVGVAEVVAVVLGLGQVGEREVDVVLGEEPDPAGLALERLARPAEPDAAALGQRVGQRHRQTAGARGAGRGDAVRGDDQSSRHGEQRTPRAPGWQPRNAPASPAVPLRPAPAASGSSRASARIAVSTATWRCRL